MKPFKKLNTSKLDSLDKSNVFIEINSPQWKNPNKISLDDLLIRNNDDYKETKKYNILKDIDNKTIVIDPKTLKIKINDSFINKSNVYHEFIEDNINENNELKLKSDSNYLYVWVGDKWKKILLSSL